MPQFSYKAIAASGEVLEGEIAASNRDDALDRLRDQGVIPIRAEPLVAGAARRPLSIKFPRSGKPNARDVVLFTRELSVLLRAGIPIDRALAKISAPHRQGRMQTIAADLLSRVKVGMQLADAMEKHETVFAPFYTGIVRAGEAGGALESALERLADSLEKSEKLRGQIRTALAYPILVLLLTTFSLVILMTNVIPEFRPLFEEAGESLPLMTQVVLAASDLTINWGWLIAVGFVALGIGLRFYWQGRHHRRWRDRWLIALPLVGDVVIKVEVARFCRTLGTLLENGVTLLQAVDISSRTLGNLVVAETTNSLRQSLAKGERMSRSAQLAAVFPELALQLVEVGEESGSLDRMLLLVADIYDAEAQRAIERMLALLVPLVTVALGIIIALVIGAMLSAILGSYQLPL